MLDFHNDTTIKIEYNPQSNKTAFPLNVIGASAGATIAVYSGITPTDANSIFVSDTSGDDTTGTGTEALPYKTILKGINSCTAAKIYVIVQDSVTYSEELSTVSNAYFTNLYADTAQTPVLSKRVLGFTPADANSIFVNATTGDDSTGDGTSAKPYATIAVGSAACDGTHNAVVITDSTTYTDAAIEFTGDFTGLYAQIGQTPTWAPSVSISTSIAKAITEFEAGATTYISTGILSSDNFVVAYTDGADSKGKFVIYDSDGMVVKSATEFEAGSTTYASVGVLSSDNFVIAYRDEGDGGKGKFVIYDSSGTIVKAITEFEAGATLYISTGILSSDNFVVAYKDNDDGGKGKFVIYDSSGTVVKAITEFESGTANHISVGVLSSDNFVIAYTDNGGKGKFVIYDSDGMVVKSATEFEAGIMTYASVGVLSSDNFVIAYKDNGDGGKGKFVIYDSDGVEVKAITDFESGETTYISTGILSSDNFVIAYQDDDDGDKGKFVIYDSSGTVVKAITEFEVGATTYASVGVLSSDNFVIAYADGGDGGKGKFIIYQSYATLITVSVASTINGLIISGTSGYAVLYLIYATAALAIKNCELVDNYLADFLYTKYAIYSDSAITMQYCNVHENGAGIYTVENTSAIQDSVFHTNSDGIAIHIKGSAASSGDITVEHCTIFSNYAGIKLESNHGTNEILKNLIIHSNDNLGIEATTAATYSYSTNTDSLSGVTAGTSVLLANPLFKNEGTLDIDDIDLNLKASLLGDTTSSPAISLGDDSRDAGGYNRLIIGSATTWTTISFEKPVTIDVWTEPVTPVKNVRKDGSVTTSREALTEYVKINFPGILNADYTEALALLKTTESQVRIYPDPTTNATDYNTYRYVYETINGSAAHYKLTRTGKQGVSLLFGRATE